MRRDDNYSGASPSKESLEQTMMPAYRATLIITCLSPAYRSAYHHMTPYNDDQRGEGSPRKSGGKQPPGNTVDIRGGTLSCPLSFVMPPGPRDVLDKTNSATATLQHAWRVSLDRMR